MNTAKCISDRSIFSSKFPKQYDSLFDYSRVLSELRPWSCSTNQNKKWLKNVKFRYCKIESKPLWRHVWSWITKLPMLYNLEKTTNVKTKTIFWSEVLQNAWINIVLHWKFWKKYGSVCHLFSCTVELSTHILSLCVPSLWFFINQPLFLKKLKFLDNLKEYLVGIGIWIWAAKS